MSAAILEFNLKFQTQPHNHIQGWRSINISAHRRGTTIQQLMYNHVGSIQMKTAL